MKHSLASRCAALAAVGCLAHGAAQAVSVGKAQGAVLIGRALDVNLPVVLDGAGDKAPECAESEIFYGDAKVPAANVRTELQSGPRGPAIRVRAGAAIDQPVVTVFLQLGCGSRFTRRLVLLAEPDLAGDVHRPVPATAITTPRTETAEAKGKAVPPSQSPASQVSQPREPLHRDGSAPLQAPTPVVNAAQLVPVQASRGPTDVMARAPVLAQPAPATRDELKLLDVPTGVVEPSPPSDDAIRQAARLQSMERDLQEIRQFLQRNEVAMLRLQAQLARAESERFANPLVYALALLLLATAAVAAYAWRRAMVAREPSADDWSHSPRTGRAAFGSAVAPASASVAGSLDSGARQASAAPARGIHDFTVDSGTTSEPPMPPTVRVPLHVTARTDDFQGSQAGSRALKAEELHDVQQEADFFSSLGEYERAIEVLRSHIQAHPETSAVAWLDLLEIYHKLGRREEFDWVRREFQQRFNAEVPAFDAYSHASAGIEAYGNAMARIAALWPSRRVLDVIEESIFRGPSKDGGQAFSLQAYRELLLLHHIGQQVLVGGDTPRTVFGDAGPLSGPHPDDGLPGFSHTSIHPLSTGMAPLDEAGARVYALDLNLDEADADQGPADDPNVLDFDLPEMPSGPGAQSRG